MNRAAQLALIMTLAATVPSVASATVNHGDFFGAQVDFLQVSETTQTAGDPEPIWDAPVLGATGDQLLFTPSAFLSSCTTGGSDVTSSELTATIQAGPGVHIEIVRLQEAGDVTLIQSPPFGDPSTNAGAAISGFVTVTEDIGGPIAPVVIPFVGTFTPTGDFELPTNFGTSAWTGDIDVDVASVVPNATKVEVSITNTLDSNCSGAAPFTSATIQKTAVTGPAVSLMVNPLLCDLELDKTCCITQPVLPDLGSCEGDMVRLQLEYTGDQCSNSSNDQGRAFRCSGRRELGEPAAVEVVGGSGTVSASPATGVQLGEVVELTSSSGTLDEKTRLEVTGPWGERQALKIDTSCERAIQCGDQFGAFEVVGFESTLGGLTDCNAPPPPAVCASGGDPVGTPCDGKVIDMVLEYTGSTCVISNPQGGQAQCDGDATGATGVGVIYTGSHPDRQILSPASGIDDGDEIRVTAVVTNGLFPNQELRVVDDSGVLQSVSFHISCSQPLDLGDQFGSFTLVEFTTKTGTTVALGDGSDGQLDACEVPLAPPGPHCTSDLQGLTLVYIGDFLGEGCSVSNPQDGQAGCSGVDDPGDPVSVSAPGLDADPASMIEFGDLVTLTATGGGDLPGLTSLSISGAGGAQSLDIATSCWKPLSLGDRFGSFVVYGMDREADGPITLGGNVQYQYAVTNPNAVTVDGITVVDDQLGTIVSGDSIAAGATTTYTANATLFGTTTNVATVSGDVMGDVCDPGVDQVTVGVTAPPPGAFNCSDPITELTMIWDGAETVDVFAWDGPAGASTLLAIANDVAPGDTLSVSGLSGAANPVWEIFDSTGATKLGESSFDVGCRDSSMNGVEDCGRRNGNLKTDDPGLIDDWLLEGMVDSDETLACTPDLVAPPPSCGFGPELVLLMPGLLWLHRRRLERKA